jgi:hypothetical protein
MSQIDKKYRGGWPAFERDVPNPTLCTDGELVRVGFMAAPDVEAFVRAIQDRGLTFVRDGRAVDCAVIDQMRGPTVPADWLVVKRVNIGPGEVAACALKGSVDDKVATPRVWRFEGSLSQTPGYAPAGHTEKTLQHLRTERGLDVYLSQLTGQEVYVGRAGNTDVRAGSVSDDYEVISRLVNRVLDLEVQADRARSTRDEALAARIYDELTDQLLPEAETLAGRSATHGSFANFACGVVLRVLHRFDEAIVRFERSLALMPDVINALLEITGCLGHVGRHSDAVKYARQAVKVEPASAAAWGNLAMCLIQARQRDEAKQAIERALRLDPADQKNRYIAENFERYFR